jgi:hypothetical protein
MSTAEIGFAVIVAIITSGGVIISGNRTSRASERAAELANRAMEHQTKLNAKAKVAEFRQRWINDLRDSMAKFVRLTNDGVSSNKDELSETMMRIELLMNRTDKNYAGLREYMADFVREVMGKGEGVRAGEFITICQDILKTEWEVLKKELLELETPQTKVS